MKRHLQLYTPLNYSLSLEFGDNLEKFKGYATIKLSLNKPSSRISLDAEELEIEDVSAEHSGRGLGVKWSSSGEHSKFVVTLNRKVRGNADTDVKKQIEDRGLCLRDQQKTGRIV